MARYALFTANARYQNPGLPPLYGPEQDVDDLCGLFKHKLGYDDAQALKGASADEVSVSFNRLGRKARPGDTVLFYFSGHGVESLDRKEQYLLFEHADLSELARGVNTPTACLAVSKLLHNSEDWRGVRRVFIFDACRVLLAARGNAGARGVASELRFGREEALNALARGPVYSSSARRQLQAQASGQGAEGLAEPPVLIKACLSSQEALELPGQKRGIFSLALGKVLDEAARGSHPVATGPALLTRLQQHMSPLLGQLAGSPKQVPWISEGAPEVLLFDPPRTAVQAAPGPAPIQVLPREARSAPAHAEPVTTPGARVTRFPAATLVAATAGTAALAVLALYAWQLSGRAPAGAPVVIGVPTPAPAGAHPPQPKRAATKESSPTRPVPAPGPSAAPKGTAAPAPAARRPADAAAALAPTPPQPSSALYMDLAALPPGKTAVMAAQGSPDLVAQLRRHLPQSQLKVFSDRFFSEGLFERVMSGDGQPIANLNVEHRVTVFRFLRVDEPRLSQPNAETQGAVEATTTVQYREMDPATGGTLRSARIELRGAGFSREKALKDLQRDLEEKSDQLN